MEDFVLREKITHFDHERIPERVVHARGTGVHGFFELTGSLAKYTTAKILCEVGAKTPVFTRISTVAGGAGSVGILIANGSDGDVVRTVTKAVAKAGASVKVVAPTVGGTKLAPDARQRIPGHRFRARRLRPPQGHRCRQRGPELPRERSRRK